MALSPLLHCDFINYDDPDYLTVNSHVQAGLSAPTIYWAFTTFFASNWHPLTWLSHALDCQLFGLNPHAHHTVNLGFHVANVLLLFFLLYRFTARLWPAALVAALFAIHPLHVQPVAWLSERKELLSSFFFLLTLLCWQAFAGADVRRRSGADTRTHDRLFMSAPAILWYLAAIFWFALGLLSKPMLVTTPFVLLLLDVWPFHRIPVWRTRRKECFRLLLEKLPFFLLSAASCVITVMAQRAGGAVKTDLALSSRLSNACVAYARYLLHTIWPTHLSIFYPHPGSWPSFTVAGSAVLLFSLSALAVWYWRKFPAIFVGWFWFLGMLVPVIGLLQVGSQSMADHYSYLPLIGLFLAGACLVSPPSSSSIPFRASSDGPNKTKLLTSCPAILIILVLSLLSNHQSNYWQNSGTIFAHAIEAVPNNYLAHNYLGLYLAEQGNQTEAISHYRASIEINPAFSESQNNLGVALSRTGQNTEAEQHVRTALLLNPKSAEAHNNLGLLLANRSRMPDAVSEYQQALQLHPNDARIHQNLGYAFASLGRLTDAIAEYQTACTLAPQNSSLHLDLAKLLVQANRLDEAKAQCHQALNLDPASEPAHEILNLLETRR